MSLALRRNGRSIVRTIGLIRAQVKSGMMNLVYNMKRLVQLIVCDMNAPVWVACVTNGIGAPAMT